MKTKKLFTRVLSVLLAACMIGTPCVPVFATDIETSEVPIEDTTVLRGDVNGDGDIDSNDAIYLLRYTMNNSRYPINQSGDMNGDGDVDSNDAIYLLRHTMNGDRYPLYVDGFTVTFDGNSFDVENLPEPQTVKPGERAAEPDAPTKPISVFTGWFTDADCTSQYVFSTPVNGNLTLYAGWECEIYSKPAEEEHVREETLVVDGEEGTFTFVDNQLVVVLEDNASREQLVTLLGDFGGEIVGEIPSVGFYQVEFSGAYTGDELLETIEQLCDSAWVEDAFLNTITEYSPDLYYPSDPFTREEMTTKDGDHIPEAENCWQHYSTWHIRATNLPAAWEIVKTLNPNPTIRLGLVDAGIEYHEDINFVDIYQYTNFRKLLETDHGTHVAGIMGAKHDGKGVAGVALNAEIHGAEAERGTGKYTLFNTWNDTIERFSILIENGAKVINFSMGINLIENNYT